MPGSAVSVEATRAQSGFGLTAVGVGVAAPRLTPYTGREPWARCRDSLLRKGRVVLDFANLLDVALGVGRDLQHPLPAIDDLSISEAVGPHVVRGSLDVIDHGGAQRWKFAECLAQVLVGVDFFVPPAGFRMHHPIDAVPKDVGVGGR